MLLPSIELTLDTKSISKFSNISRMFPPLLPYYPYPSSVSHPLLTDGLAISLPPYDNHSDLSTTGSWFLCLELLPPTIVTLKGSDIFD